MTVAIVDFVARCDRFASERGVSRVWMSKRLFSDTRKLDQLANGEADVGVRRLAKADADLAALIRNLHEDSSAVEDSVTVAPGDDCGAEKNEPGFSPAGVAA